MKPKKKNQKPIELDAYLKYRCQESNCGYDHWLSLKEAQTKNFKIVCDCGSVFKPKQIEKIDITYVDTKSIEQTKDIGVSVTEKPKIPIDLQNSCARLLISYGFTREEALKLASDAFEKNPVTSGSLLVKQILTNLGESNVSN